MDTRHTTITHVILDPGALIAELDLLKAPGITEVTMSVEAMKSLVYRHMRIVAASQVVAEEMAARVEPGVLDEQITTMHARQIASEITKELKLTTEVSRIDWRRDDPWHVTKVTVQ